MGPLAALPSDDRGMYRRARLMLSPASQSVPRRSAAEAIRDLIKGEAQEVVIVAALDESGVRNVVEVARGDYHRVRLPLPAMLAVPLLAGTGWFVIAHNHPSGRLIPSQHDYDLTKSVINVANACGLILHDHLIFGPAGQYLSLRAAHVLEVPDPVDLELQA